ncbi:MAG: hypothetical protein VX466_13310 [Myxococcota bacterium]|nr:hypothetical protein [Myxococcota bacterium]
MPRQTSAMGASGLFALLAVVFTICLATLPDDIYPGDPVAMRISAAALLKFGEPGLPADRVAQRDLRKLVSGSYFAENEARGRWYSKYGILTTLLYVPPLGIEQLVGGELSLARLGTSSLRLILGLYQLGFVLLVAFYLHQLAALYARGKLAPPVFALCVLFSTFTWNYARAQSSEIFQLAFFLGFYVHLIRWWRAGAKHDLHLAEGWIVLLVLTKSFHIVLVPVLAILALTREWDRSTPLWVSLERELRTHWRFQVVHVWAPMLLLGLLLLGINGYKFGDPFATGYTEAPHLLGIFGGNFLEGLSGFLFGPQQSVLTHFPLLLLSLLGAISFARRFPFELGLAWAVFLLYLLSLSSYVYWDGSWSYGPRYLLPVLPLVSLPFIDVVDGCSRNLRRWVLAVPLIVVVLGTSTALQWKVNGLPFLSHLYVSRLFTAIQSPHIDAFFAKRHVGLVHRDLIAWREGEAALEPIEVARNSVSKARLEAIEQMLRAMLQPNYRWLK